MAHPKRLYAQGTTVSSASSRAQIEALLIKAGATSYASGYEGERANILFKMQGRRIRFTVKLLNEQSMVDTRENMRRWRALFFLLKAKLAAVADGLATFEEEFLAFTIVPGANGETVAQWLGPQLARAYESGVAMPPLLGAGA